MDNDQQARHEFNHPKPKPPGLLAKVLAFALSALLLVLAFMFSVVALAVVAVGGIVLWGYIWWKTRALRQQMKEMHARERERQEQVIEGEFFRETGNSDRLLR